MVEVTKHMGSFHIIDGEKVSIRYKGQTRSFARCHRPETQCPGKGVARECSSERILLSTHMQDHWKDIGYKPDNSEEKQKIMKDILENLNEEEKELL